MLKYKGYTGYVEFVDEAELLHGEVLDAIDVITFQGKTVEDMRKAFRDSLDDYLEFYALGRGFRKSPRPRSNVAYRRGTFARNPSLGCYLIST
mgnify:CR=1 FL=1